VPEEWRRPHGFFSATYRGEAICKGVGPVTLEIGIDMRPEAYYSNHPHVVITDQDGAVLLDRWIIPDRYACNYFAYDMERSMRTYEGPLQLGILKASVFDLARVLDVRLEGCQRATLLRQPWPYGK